MSEIPIQLNLPDKAHTITSKFKSVLETHLTLEGRYKQYLAKYEKVHGALPKNEQDNIEQAIADKLYRKAKLSFVRDAAIVVGVVCSGIYLYKNGAIIADGIQNLRENSLPLERKNAIEWAGIFRSKGELHVFGELPRGDHMMGGVNHIGGDQRFYSLNGHSPAKMIDRITDYLGQGFGLTTKIAEETNFRDKPNPNIFVLFSTLGRDYTSGIKRWKRDPSHMIFQYHTKWSAKNIIDQRGPITRYDLLSFVPRKEGKQFIRQALEEPEILEDVFGILCGGLEKTTTRIPAERVAFYEGGPVWKMGRLLGNVSKVVKPLGRFFGTPDPSLR